MTDWYRLSADETLSELGSRPEGLSSEEAQRRLAEHGPNELAEAGVKSPWRILAEQFTSLLIIILIIAAVVSAYLGDYEDAIVIMAIVVLNGALGFRQEYKAEKTMSALRKLAAPVVRVRRAGEVTEVAAADLVPGDVVLLEAGNVIPADARLIHSASLRVQEAALTGESEPVEKIAEALAQSEVPLADRVNMLFMGTSASYGRAEAVIVGTGMGTELGKIAGMIQNVEREPTPLQKRLGQLGRWLAIAALVLVIVIFAQGLMQGRRPEGHVPDGREHGRGRRARGPARYRDRGPLPRCAENAAPQGPHPQATGRRDAGLRDRHLLGQDGHPHREPHDGGHTGRRRPRDRPAAGDEARSSRGPRRGGCGPGKGVAPGQARGPRARGRGLSVQRLHTADR